MKHLIVSTVVVAIATSAASAQQAVQWRVEDGGNGHWYARLGQGGCWSQRRNEAVALGGHLATVTDAAELAFCEGLAPWHFYMGGYRIVPVPAGDDQDGWRWVTGEPFPMSLRCISNFPLSERWVSGSPALGCVGESNECDPYWYLVEWSADCNNDGIVDYGQCRDGSLPDYNGNSIPDCCEAGVPCTVGRYPVQWSANKGGNGHWYHVRDRVPRHDWNDWRLDAESIGAHLVTITSIAENQFVSSRQVWGTSAPSCVGGHALIGLFQPAGSPEPSGGWQWVTGEPFVFDANQWGSLEDCCEGNPYCGGDGEDAAALWSWAGDCEVGSGLAGKWNDVGKCLDWWGAVFEWDADCNGDGIVDYGQILRGQLVDADSNGVPDSCECPGDVTGNDLVDGVDLAAILGAWGTDGQNQYDCDIDNDGIVNGQDLAFVLGGWGPCP
jgi:hypothetical protein